MTGMASLPDGRPVVPTHRVGSGRLPADHRSRQVVVVLPPKCTRDWASVLTAVQRSRFESPVDGCIFSVDRTVFELWLGSV